MENKKEKGLYMKYRVQKFHGTTDPKAKYIVLRYDELRHLAERQVLKYYADLIEKYGYEKFAEELREELKKTNPLSIQIHR